jgi:secondary thiamine-phosphate synthase enzyme
MIDTLIINTRAQGLLEITNQVQSVISKAGKSEGLCTLFVKHTSCSLIIQENADPTAQQDLEQWLNRLVKENDSLYTHTFEGPDDMPAHIKSVLTATHLSIPYHNNQLTLGCWQGIFLWEHRHRPHTREIIIHI